MMSWRDPAGVAEGAEDLALFRSSDHTHSPACIKQSRRGASGEQSVLENLDGDSNRMRERETGARRG
jgi:hypothetical protein